jgi:hypothetical protein
MARESLLNKRSNGLSRTHSWNKNLRISGRSGDIKVIGRAMNVNTGINMKEEVSMISCYLKVFTKHSPLYQDDQKRISRHYFNYQNR